MPSKKINFWIIAQDITIIFTFIFIPLFILLQIIKGINYFESLSAEWWMCIGLIIVMLQNNFMGLGELDRLKKYLEIVVKRYKSKNEILPNKSH